MQEIPFRPIIELRSKHIPKIKSSFGILPKKSDTTQSEMGQIAMEQSDVAILPKPIKMKDKRKLSTLALDYSDIMKNIHSEDITRKVREPIHSEEKFTEISVVGTPEVLKIGKTVRLVVDGEVKEMEHIEKTFDKDEMLPPLDDILEKEVEPELLEEKVEPKIMEETEEKVEPKIMEEKEVEVEAPVPLPKKRKLRIKGKEFIAERELINVDLSTAKIRDQLVNERLPLPSEKVIVKAPSYYMNNRKLFINKLNQLFQPYREELLANESNISCESRGSSIDFELLTHQKIVRDYLNIYTPYRGLLLYHGLGSGKTCTSIAISEGMKSDKQIYILTPASLKMNFLSELKKCGDQLYKKNQYWEFVSIEGNPSYVPILAKALMLSTEYITKNNGAWLVDIKKASNYTTLTTDQQKDIDEQLNFMIRAKYKDINYNGLTKRIFDNLTNNGSRNPFDNSTIIIDEAHNFVSRIVNKLKSPTSVSYKLYEYLMSATNARVVLLTGTPIINYPNEIGILYNILRGYIKTWTMQVKVKTSEKINTDSILKMFDDANFRTYDYVDYSGDRLTITRNPFGFINAKKRGVVKGTQRKGTDKDKGKIDLRTMIFGGTKKQKRVSNRKTKKTKYDEIVDKLTYNKLSIDEDEDVNKAYRVGYNFENEVHMGGGEVFDKYDGVRVDATGNISDTDFQNTVLTILTKNGLEVPTNSIVVANNKALPDNPEAFLETFVDTDSGDVKNIDVFKRRILGLSSYFRSAQEQLLPSFVKTEEGDIFHVVKTEMTSHQFGVYEKIRKIEAEQEKRNRKNQKKAKAGNDDMYKIASTYRIFSRAACNFTFPDSIQRPLPNAAAKDVGEVGEIDENQFNAVPIQERLETDVYADTEDIEKEDVSDNSKYQKRIDAALDELAYKPEREREVEYLKKDALFSFSPKFVSILENIQSEDNQGLHLVYSQFRTIEGIGLLKLILEANGYAEFKINKNVSTNSWEIVEKPGSQGKPRFVLYTGTETTEEKEIVRNIYNSSWEFVPANIVSQLQEINANNYLGEVIKVFMITSSGAEGINLKNTRFVHIVEPYWHMVRIEQVIGRARRICSHQDLPEELRTVKVFLYLSTLSEEQRTSEKNIELRIRDISRFDKKTPVTTDETLFEMAVFKDRINRQILKAVKESSMDCSLYAGKNKDEPLVCYGYGKVESNQFGSYPSFDQDRSEKTVLNRAETTWEARKITYKGKKYALREDTKEIFDLDSYLLFKETGTDPILVGNMVQKGKVAAIEFI